MLSKEDNQITGKTYLILRSRHNIKNAMYQARLPLSDGIYGVNRMCPPELLHTLDAGLSIYILESLQDSISGGQCREDLDKAHMQIMYRTIKRQSERDLPRGAIRSGLIETTRCQSSERKGNLFLLLCIGHTTAGALILRHELDLAPGMWKQWLIYLQMYLGMEEWFHDSRPKEEVQNARNAIGAVIQSLQYFFPRKRDSHGYNIPKMHGLKKVQYYMCLYGSAMNFYGGPGEASHKSFVKAPGARTQRRVGEFATQTAEQYYGIMAVDKVTRLVDVRLPKEYLQDENIMYSENITREYNVSGSYYVTILPDGSHKLKSDSKQLTTSGIDDNLLAVHRRLVMNNEEWDGEAPCTLTGYTHAIVNGDDGESIKYNAHPCYHGAAWYDWAYVQYDIDGEQMFYPSRVLGFTMLGDGSINAIIQYGIRWRM